MNPKTKRKARMVFTVGHSTRSFSDFLKTISAYGVGEVIDVRTIPKSRANPQFNESRLEKGLARHGIRYKHMKELGGLRHPSKDSINTYWRNASFKGFADYMQTDEFEKALGRLADEAGKRTVALMCAEAVPWRCHRSLIADALAAKGIKAIHIMSATNSREHVVTKSARKVRGRLVYR